MSSLFLPFHPLIRHPRYRNTQIQTQTEKQTDGRTDSHVSTRAHSYLLINIHPSTQERLLHSGLQLCLVLSSLYTSLLYHLLYHYLILLLVCLPTPLSSLLTPFPGLNTLSSILSCHCCSCRSQDVVKPVLSCGV